MEEEYEEFNITDWDIENEFNPNRVRRPISKKQQIYGVFGGEDSDDDEGPIFNKASKTKSTINFVSGGLANAADQNKDSDKKSDTFSFKPKGKPQPKFEGTDMHFGKWEQHTKGIGAKLLQQMGYQPGKGLGKSLQGITTPVETNKRPGKGALGFYGPESNQKPKKGEENEEEVELKKQLHQWKKKDVKKDIKYSYRTLDEINDDNASKKFLGEVNSVKVIDMTGPKQRVLSGYHQIHQQHTKPEVDVPQTKNFQLPELEHNINILVNVTEKDIVHTNLKIKYHKETIANLQLEEENIANTLETEKSQIEILENLITIISNLKDSSKLDEVADILVKLQKDYFEEYKMFKLGDLALSIVFPLMHEHFKSWEPFKNPSYGYDLLTKWRPLLECDTQQQEMDLYQQLLWEIWMPPLRKVVQSWDPHYCDAFVDFLDKWKILLPRWMFENILDQLVLPALQKEVDAWNPLTDTVAIHSWIHPWLPHMKNKLEPIYAPIRQKIASALRNWDPSDSSAKLILQPWKDVFSKGTMEAFVITNILPKLAGALQNFEINPQHQQLAVWNWVMSWEEFLPVTSLVTLLEKHFFPKWIYALCNWLSQNPNSEEVRSWYLGWKSMFSESLFNNPVVKEFFSRALDVMRQSNTQGTINPANFYHYYEPIATSKPPLLQREYQDIKPTYNYRLSFKELIENKAKEKGVLFAPIPNRFYDSKQVYCFGSSIMYIDDGKLYVNNDKTWVPTSLATLLDRAAM